MANVQIVLFSLFLLARSSFSCSDIVNFSSGDFTITGPCPNSTVIAPVGSTVQYICDYEDRTGLINVPYWHIAGLSGTPFLHGEGTDHSIEISGLSVGAYTDITISILEQYLNNTLTIQCGLCSAALVCYDFIKPKINRLSENIISTTTVELVTFGPPRALSYITNQTSAALNWSPPLVSADYNNTVVFQYELTITQTSHSMVFNTTNTHYNITEDDIPVGSDICSDYSWSVRAVYGELASEIASGNDNITIPSSPMIESDSFNTNVSECMNSLTLSTFIKIHSCHNVPQYNVTLTFAERNIDLSTIIITDANNIYVVMATYVTHIEVANELLNGSVMICASNQYNNDCVVYELQDYSVDILSCAQLTMESQTAGSLASTISNTVISSSIIINTVSTSIIHTRPTSTDTPLPSLGPADSTPLSDTYIIIIPVVVAMIIGSIIVCIIIIIISIRRQRRKSQSLKILSSEDYTDAMRKRRPPQLYGEQKNASFKYANVPSPCLTPIGSNGGSTVPEYIPQIDTIECPTYAMPLEMSSSLSKRRSESRPNSYTPSQILSLHNHLPQNGYSEPFSSVPRVDEAVYSTINPPETTPIHQSTDLVDVPGYTVPKDLLTKIRRNSRKDSIHSRLSITPRHSCSSLPATPAHDKTSPAVVLQTLNGIDEVDGTNPEHYIYDEINKENISVRVNGNVHTICKDPPPPEYVDINEIKRRKRNKLNLQTAPPVINGTPTSNGINHSVLSSSDDADADDEATETSAPEYVPVDEIRKRKRDQSLKRNISLGCSQNDVIMIELKELPPPTPTHDLATPSPPPVTPPPIPSHLLSPLHQTTVN